MRTIGNLIFLPLLAIFGFGFLLAHTLNISQDLVEARGQLAQMHERYQALNSQYQVVVEERNVLAEKTAELTDVNAGLDARIKSLEAERQILTSQLETLQTNQAAVEKNDIALSSLDYSSMKHVVNWLGLPMTPIILGAVYAFSRSRILKHSGSSTQGDGQTTFQVLLTREELQLIARRRRSLQAQDRAK